MTNELIEKIRLVPAVWSPFVIISLIFVRSHKVFPFPWNSCLKPDRTRLSIFFLLKDFKKKELVFLTEQFLQKTPHQTDDNKWVTKSFIKILVFVYNLPTQCALAEHNKFCPRNLSWFKNESCSEDEVVNFFLSHNFLSFSKPLFTTRFNRA